MFICTNRQISLFDVEEGKCTVEGIGLGQAEVGQAEQSVCHIELEEDEEDEGENKDKKKRYSKI